MLVSLKKKRFTEFPIVTVPKNNLILFFSPKSWYTILEVRSEKLEVGKTIGQNLIASNF